HLGANLVTVDEFSTLGGGVALFDLGAVLGEPRVSFVQQLKSLLDHFLGALVGTRTQRLRNESVLFWLQNNGHSESSLCLLCLHRTPAHGSGQASSRAGGFLRPRGKHPNSEGRGLGQCEIVDRVVSWKLIFSVQPHDRQETTLNSFGRCL